MLIEEFLKYLQYELFRSPHTLRAYENDCREFTEFLKEASGGDSESDLTLVTPLDVRRWIASLAATCKSPRSLRRKAQSIRALFKFMCRRHLIDANPAESLQLAKIPRPLPNFVPENEMEERLGQLAHTCENVGDVAGENISVRTVESTSPHIFALRDHLILHLLYATGLRRSELLSLTDNSLQLSGSSPSLKVLGKGNKERIVPLADPLVKELQRWQTARDAEWPGLHTPKPLIATAFGAMSCSQLARIVLRLLDGTKATRRSPHTVRHTFATAMLNGGADLNTIREMLGHSSIATTQVYTHLQFTDLASVYGAAHPRGNKGK